ncbi:hypothetical protein FBY37_3144 [Streptomyces sp. SLBN-134]|nr:hypothetical protein FBY37_3144 [Streptomyces sp. SLBN-134]
MILTYAWDRLLIDPLPGPRGADSFTGLEPVTQSVRSVPAEAQPIAPAGSTLPRLATELPHTLALLDPHHGAEGITRQLEELVSHLAPASIDLLDVGGDILAQGDEPTLKSPLAHALTLAACCQVNAPIRLLVAGPGLDGEISPTTCALCSALPSTPSRPRTWRRSAASWKWHPSEATAMLAATARGARGICEVRDAGLPVPLTDEGPTVHEVDLDDAVSRNSLAPAIMTIATLDEAEAHSREICGFSEIDYERNKAAWLTERPPTKLDPDDVLSRLDQFQSEARARGVTHTTFRHLTEVLHLSGSQRDELRRLLIHSRPGQYDAPLWSIGA